MIQIKTILIVVSMVAVLTLIGFLVITAWTKETPEPITEEQPKCIEEPFESIGGRPLEKNISVIDSIKTTQEEYIKTHARYQQQSYKDGDKEIKVVEYLTPNEEVGYQIIIKDASTTESVGYGVEAESRTWIRQNPIITNYASST